MILKNGCKCQEQSNKTMYKSSRHTSIKKGIGYNRYDEKTNNRRNMINGVPCVKFNKGVALDDLLCKANNVYIPKIAPTSDKIGKSKQVEAPCHNHQSRNAMLVTTCVVGARMARLW